MRPPLTPVLLGALLALPAAGHAMVVPLDHSTRLALRGSAASIVVGNPNIADVTVVDSHNVYVQAKAYGMTNIVVLDSLGRTLYADDIKVEPAGNNVSVYHGLAKADFACSPRCQTSAAPQAAQPNVLGTVADLMSGRPAAALGSALATGGSAAAAAPLSTAASSAH